VEMLSVCTVVEEEVGGRGTVISQEGGGGRTRNDQISKALEELVRLRPSLANRLRKKCCAFGEIGEG